MFSITISRGMSKRVGPITLLWNFAHLMLPPLSSSNFLRSSVRVSRLLRGLGFLLSRGVASSALVIVHHRQQCLQVIKGTLSLHTYVPEAPDNPYILHRNS